MTSLVSKSKAGACHGGKKKAACRRLSPATNRKLRQAWTPGMRDSRRSTLIPTRPECRARASWTALLNSQPKSSVGEACSLAIRRNSLTALVMGHMKVESSVAIDGGHLEKMSLNA